ncbi:MAG: 6-bladed beta-propeller [Verrucomicrobiota bacterium]|jgi:ABC-type Fe3+ transport system permease subunit/DNA-binding beta-propeller fold protein YncE
MNWLLLKNSLLVSGLATLLAVSFGLVAALWLAGLPRRWRNRLLAVAVAALALPPFLVTNCWLRYLGHSGLWHSWLPLSIISPGGTIWILSLLTWPITLLAVWSAWQRLEPAQLESDPALTGWALVRGLLLPLARNALAQAAVLTFVLALNNFAVPAILQVKVFPAEMWVRFNTSFDTLGALELSWPLVLGPLLLLLWLSRQEIPWPRLEGPVPPKLFRRQLGRGWFWSAGALALLLCLLAVGLPLLQLVSGKRTWTELPAALAAGQTAVWNSVWFAASSATVVIGLALAGAASQQCRHRAQTSGCAGRCAPLIGWLLWLPFLVPGVLLGIGWIALFNRPWTRLFYQSAGIVILAFVVRYLALGWNTVAHAAQGVDRDLTDAARLEGATRWQMLRYVHWPQVAPQVAAAWYIVFLLCLWDVESMILVVPPGGETVALRVFNLLHYGHNAQVNALCLTLVALALAPLALWKACDAARARASRLAHHTSPLCACLLLLLAGCAPGPASNELPLQSRLFSRVQVIGSRGVGLGQLNKPRSVAVDRQDNLYVVDMTGRVQKFSSNGLFLLSWQMPQTDLGKPKGMCRDREGNIIVVEPHYQRVNHFSPAGQLVRQWGRPGTNAGQFLMPRAVAVNSQNEILVSEYGPVERVQRFSLVDQAPGPPVVAVVGQASRLPPLPLQSNAGGTPAPPFLGSFGQAGNGPGEFNRPEGLCVDAQDRVYVADSCNHRIQVFSRDGKFLRAYGKAGQGRGGLSYPYDICVDAAGRQYVCEFGNSRIQVFDANDQPLETLGGPGAAPGQFSNPWGVALDSAGNLYVADSQNHRVQKFIHK